MHKAKTHKHVNHMNSVHSSQKDENASLASISLPPRPETIDDRIRFQIEKLTEENSSVWTSPDYNRREYLHSFFQYPAMMVPAVQRLVVNIIQASKPGIKNVVDPFMGSATSLVACMENGLNCYGQDVNPLAKLIAETRTGPYYVEAIKERKLHLLDAISKDDAVNIEANFIGLWKWFKTDVAIELSKIVRAIRKEQRLAIRRFYWVNLAEVVRISSNDRTSTFKLHARPIEEINVRNISPIREFKNRLSKSIEDLERFRDFLAANGRLSKGSYKGIKKITLQDSTKRIVTPKGQKDFFDLLVTSPPYGDNKTTVTYGQHSFLPLQWIDLEDIDESAGNGFLKTTMEIDSRSLGGRIKHLSDLQLESLFIKSRTFEMVYKQLLFTTNERLKKVMIFIQDLFSVVEQISYVMKPNSYQVWTIGNRTVGGVEIPNNQILKEFMSHVGCKLVAEIEREIINKRMARRNGDSVLMNVEDILIFRKVG
ncbi:site-specific DNA-methyltransferase [Dyadobacter flavalbus]|nr:site-specific DNA-methyltransferase [Dyadobacter flavalbus]